MQNVTVIQGRKIKPTDIQLIQQLLAENPSWGRSRLSLELCQQWNWRRPDQSPKDMACRSLLLKLGRAGQIVLPPRKGGSPNALRNRSIPSIPHSTEEIDGNLKALVPLQVMPLSPRSDGYSLFQCLLSRYHYLWTQKHRRAEHEVSDSRSCRTPIGMCSFWLSSLEDGPSRCVYWLGSLDPEKEPGATYQ